MARCQSCGGVIGVDCFNPQECAWITEQQEKRAREQQRDCPSDHQVLLEIREEISKELQQTIEFNKIKQYDDLVYGYYKSLTIINKYIDRHS